MRDTSGEHHYRGGTMKRLLGIIEARFVSHLARMECRIMSNFDDLKAQIALLQTNHAAELSAVQASSQRVDALAVQIAAHPAVQTASVNDADLQSLVDELKQVNADTLTTIATAQANGEKAAAAIAAATPADPSTGSASADAGAGVQQTGTSAGATGA